MTTTFREFLETCIDYETAHEQNESTCKNSSN